MKDWLRKHLTPCFSPRAKDQDDEQGRDDGRGRDEGRGRDVGQGRDDGQEREDDGLGGENDPYLTYEDLRNHAFGQFSTSAVSASRAPEDRFQVEVGRQATFIGVYDGHGGAAAADYVTEHLLGHLTRIAREEGRRISPDIISNAFAATENGFLDHVRNGFAPAFNGTCCLVGVIWNKTLFVANLGDCRAVTSAMNGHPAHNITQDHNASVEPVRHELRQLHPDDPNIVIDKHGIWRVKGKIQITRSIGDFYLKYQEFAIGPTTPRFHIPEPIVRPILRADPEIHIIDLERTASRFYIFASDGLWEKVTSDEAVQIVLQNPRQGIARRLAVRALQNAARGKEITYTQLVDVNIDDRRPYHDDISVVVIYVDHLEPVHEGPSTSTTSNFEF